MSEENKNRSKFYDLPPNWKEVFKRHGDEGSTIKAVMLELGIGNHVRHSNYMKKHPEYMEAVEDFELRSAVYWENLAKDYAKGNEHLSNTGSVSALQFNMINRRNVGWTNKSVIEQNTTITSDESAVELFTKLLESTKKD
jgi:hypothetical protein